MGSNIACRVLLFNYCQFMKLRGANKEPERDSCCVCTLEYRARQIDDAFGKHNKIYLRIKIQ